MFPCNPCASNCTDNLTRSIGGAPECVRECDEGGCTAMKKQSRFWSPILFVCAFAVVGANAQSFRAQCPASTITHPNATDNNSEPSYVGPSYAGVAGYPSAQTHVN